MPLGWVLEHMIMFHVKSSVTVLGVGMVLVSNISYFHPYLGR